MENFKKHSEFSLKKVEKSKKLQFSMIKFSFVVNPIEIGTTSVIGIIKDCYANLENLKG